MTVPEFRFTQVTRLPMLIGSIKAAMKVPEFRFTQEQSEDLRGILCEFDDKTAHEMTLNLLTLCEFALFLKKQNKQWDISLQRDLLLKTIKSINRTLNLLHEVIEADPLPHRTIDDLHGMGQHMVSFSDFCIAVQNVARWLRRIERLLDDCITHQKTFRRGQKLLDAFKISVTREAARIYKETLQQTPSKYDGGQSRHSFPNIMRFIFACIELPSENPLRIIRAALK